MPEIRERFAEMIRTDKRTQKELADEAGISQQTISAIVKGVRTDLRAEVVARLGRELGLSPTALGKMLYECHPKTIS